MDQAASLPPLSILRLLELQTQAGIGNFLFGKCMLLAGPVGQCSKPTAGLRCDTVHSLFYFHHVIGWRKKLHLSIWPALASEDVSAF